MSCRRNRGFTLVELMITVAVVAVLSAIAFPSFNGVIRSNRLATASNDFIATFSLARSEAIRNSRGAGVCPSSTGTSCGADWNTGWMAWSDANANGAFDAGETVLRYSQAKPQLVVSAAASRLTFNNRGRMIGVDGDDAAMSGSQSITLTAKDCPAGQQYVRVVTISGTGQTRTTKENCK